MRKDKSVIKANEMQREGTNFIEIENVDQGIQDNSPIYPITSSNFMYHKYFAEISSSTIGFRGRF